MKQIDLSFTNEAPTGKLMEHKQRAVQLEDKIRRPQLAGMTYQVEELRFQDTMEIR